MPLNAKTPELFQGFSKLSREQRFERLFDMGALTAEDILFLRQGGVKDTKLADKLIENVIGYFQLPLGVATNFQIDGQDYVIPMAVEETSIVAALSKTAKWIRQYGAIETEVLGDCIIGQIQFAKVHNFQQLAQSFTEQRLRLIQLVNKEVLASMVQRGGGVKDLKLRSIARPDGGDMAVIHMEMDCCDAMGANIMNQALEYLKGPLEALTGEQVSVCILSNLNDQKLTSARVRLQGIDPDLADRIQEASLFAEIDPYRAATHNKGVMNGIDPLLIATGNDWRAVEAAVHAYASREGQYQAISRWRYQDEALVGELTAPIIVGTVGGVTAVHPTAKLGLRMLGVESANHLSRIIAAVGLVQNLGALRALCTEGIIQGHMKLHIDNLLLVAGASDEEMPLLKERLQQFLSHYKRVSLSNAFELLAEIRKLPSMA